MHLTDDGRTAPGWARETLAGITGALAALPPVLTIGLLAFSPLGTAAPQVALFAAFVTAGIGGLAHALLSRTRMPMAGPSSATALTLSTLVAQLAAEPRLAPASAAGLQGIIALCALAVLLSGAMQIGFALLGWARLARVVPQPVLAGFMNGAALLILLAQLPMLLGLPLGAGLTLQNLQGAQALALALGLGTAGLILWLTRRAPRLPSVLLVLLAGTVLHGLLSAWLGDGVAGATVGALPPVWPWPVPTGLLWSAAGLELVRAHGPQVLATALALATIGALESSLSVRAVDQMLGARHDPRRELMAIGCGNMLCGLLGGVPLAAIRIRVLATLQAGGRGRIAVLAGPVAFGLLYLLGGPLLAALPLPLLAGVMLTVALRLADRWTGRLLQRWWAGDHSRDLLLGLGTVALVVGTMLWRGMPSGIGLGVLLALLTFALRMNRSLVNDRYLASARPSRRIYPAAMEALLRPLRTAIVVFEIEGPLFFGSGDRLLDEAETLDGGCRWLVLDLRRVGTIDESGAVALQTTVLQAAQRGIRVELAGLADGSAPALALRSFAPALPHWPDADRAIEAAEMWLLEQAHGNVGGDHHDDGDVRAMAEVPLAESSLLAGLGAAQAAAVCAHLARRELAAGEVLFAEGAPGDCLYVVGKGSVSVLSRPDKSGRTQRYLSVSPGMMLGETAMLDGGGRTASAVADAPSTVYALTLAALEELGRSHPNAAIRLHRNMALHLSQRLRAAASAWQASAR